jgi:uncharacterized protein
VDTNGLIDREAERSALRGLLDRNGAQITLITGRRRVGKTFLLARSWPPEHTFAFTATRSTPEQNRRQLVLDLSAWLGEPLDPADYPSWRAVFDLLWRIRPDEAQVVVIDEFQYLAASAQGLAEVASALNATFERTPVRRPFVLALSGSAVSTLIGLATGGAPLYGRLALHLKLEPLGPLEAAAFVPTWSARERAAGFGTLGGTPAYWSLVDPNRDLRSNLSELVLAPTGRLRLQLDTVLDQEEGLGDTPAYRGIVRAIAGGATTRPRIADATGLKLDQSLVRRLDGLIEIGIIEVVPNYEAPRNAAVRYRVSDPAIRFYEALVMPNTSLLERVDPITAFDAVIAPRLDTFLGHAFERLVEPTYERLRAERHLPMARTWSRWEGRDRTGRGIEIDLVAPLASGEVMTGSVKWNREPLTPQVFVGHVEALRRAADAGRRWAHAALRGPVLFLGAGGFDPRFHAVADTHAGTVLTWSLDEVYTPV